MPKPWWKRAGGERPAVSADFSHALMRQVLRTELIRIKALIATAAVLALMILGLYAARPLRDRASLAWPSDAGLPLRWS